MNDHDSVQHSLTRYKLHPAQIFLSWLEVIKALIPLIIIVAFDIRDATQLEWYHTILPGILLFGLFTSYLSWQRFYYVLEHDRLRIHKGILFREERNLYYSRIHSVNVEQPLIHRLLGVARIKIEMPGGKTEGDGVLKAITLNTANELEQWIRSQSSSLKQKKEVEVETQVKQELGREQSDDIATRTAISTDVMDNKEDHGNNTNQTATYTLKLPFMKVLFASMTTVNIGLVITFILGVISFADDILPAAVYNRILSTAQTIFPTWWGIVIVGVVAAWILSTVLYILKYGGFQLESDGSQISISYGLLEKKKHVFRIKRVQAIVVKEGILRQALGYAEVGLHVVSSNKNETVILHPFIRKQLLQSWLAEMVPQFNWVEREKRSPMRALWTFLKWDIFLNGLIIAAAVWYFGMVGWWALLLFVVTVPLSYTAHSDEGFTCRDEQLTIWKRDLARYTIFARRRQLVTFEKRSTPIQKKLRLQRMKVKLMGDVGGTSFSTQCLDEHEVEEVWNWFKRDTRQYQQN
ncbi:PH domain-containing protein [Paenibacillus sp. SC116]|uniref:PH domain-containing protein n=1 Tax=Paenibacillus sp. SC116 TaxID=2968986 RepID=UPI00215AFB51|nr:PH domain-containing protein [Paenibacillus sp. SC116]MCR8843269.1 PH domain-containing protein [Paenibacillus sp. SC116]